jgi:protein-disulfide isomerase
MVECDYCEEEFDSKEKMHRHWGEEHEDELNSHEKEKVKKAERKYQEQKDAKIRKRKQYAGYGLGAALVLALIGIVGAQMLGGGGDTSALDKLEDQPTLGPEDAEVTVIEFGDYSCHHCKSFHMESFPQLKSNYIDTDKVNFKFVNYAFLAQSSTDAAAASECVYNQDKEQFWDYHDAIFRNAGTGNWATTDNLVGLARENTEGLDYDQLRSCINGKKTLDEVQQDKRIGSQAGVSGTPAIYVNGNKVNGYEYQTIKSAIEKEMGE